MWNPLEGFESQHLWANNQEENTYKKIYRHKWGSIGAVQRERDQGVRPCDFKAARGRSKDESGDKCRVARRLVLEHGL